VFGLSPAPRSDIDLYEPCDVPAGYWHRAIRKGETSVVILDLDLWRVRRDDLERIWPRSPPATPTNAAPASVLPEPEVEPSVVPIDQLATGERPPEPKDIPVEAEPEPGTTAAPIDDRLANWIFDQHDGRSPIYDELLKKARALGGQLGQFRTTDFLAAYQRVYQTKANAPPATGWPLRSPYRERATERKVAE
jgi:hypothetical protein